MEQIKAFFINWQALAIACGSFVMLGLLRSILTKRDEAGKIIGGIAQNKWFKAFLPVYPYVISVLLAFAIPMPDVIVELGKKGIMARVLFGLYAGWLSGYSFQVIKKILENVFNIKFDSDQGVSG